MLVNLRLIVLSQTYRYELQLLVVRLETMQLLCIDLSQIPIKIGSIVQSSGPITLQALENDGSVIDVIHPTQNVVSDDRISDKNAHKINMEYLQYKFKGF